MAGPSTEPERPRTGTGRPGRQRRLLALPVLIIVALACSQGPVDGGLESDASSLSRTRNAPTAAAVDQGGSSLNLRTPTEPPPRVDTSISAVPVEEVVFDTFRGGFVRLSAASDETIEALRDRIRPIYEPRYDDVEGGDWLRDGDMVLGYVSDQDEAFAYPVKMLNLHEIVNDVIDDVPVLVSYCPLCASGVVYSREFDGRVLLFGNTSALYESDLVMYDHETGSYWFQVLGEAIVGPLSGGRLTMLPSTMTTWVQWKRLHPDTEVLSRDLGLFDSGSRYDRDPFIGYDDSVNRGRFSFPVSEDKLDDRLLPGARVLAIQVDESHKAYALTGRPDAVTNDEVGGRTVVVISREEGPTASAYGGVVEGRTLTFRLDGEEVVDVETGTVWDDAGRAVSGPLAGTQLERVPSRASFWFSVVGALPEIELHAP